MGAWEHGSMGAPGRHCVSLSLHPLPPGGKTLQRGNFRGNRGFLALKPLRLYGMDVGETGEGDGKFKRRRTIRHQFERIKVRRPFRVRREVILVHTSTRQWERVRGLGSQA